jgi:hypothetical protein
MMVEIYEKEPPEISGKKPIQTYETQYVYTGFRRYDVKRKMMMEFVETVKGLVLKEIPMEMDVFSRGYSVEKAIVYVYSESPRIWKEVLNPFVTHFFIEVQDQPVGITAST